MIRKFKVELVGEQPDPESPVKWALEAGGQTTDWVELAPDAGPGAALEALLGAGAEAADSPEEAS